MIETLNSEIEKVNSNLEVLPTNNQKNRDKYHKYLDECIDKYQGMLDEASNIIKSRYSEVLSKFKNLTYQLNNTDVDYNTLKLTDSRATCCEKMNLDYLFYKLNNSTDNNLEEVNKILVEIINTFKAAGIALTSNDFSHSEAVNTYMKALFSNSENIQDVFNDIYWKNSDLLVQIELNIKYLYYKYESKLAEFFNAKYASFDFDKFISSHRELIYNNELIKHRSVRYIFDLFMDKVYDVDDFIIESRVQDLISGLLLDPTSNRNYENLLKLKSSLFEYKNYVQYEYIFKDFKELFAHKEEFKDLFANKLKDIAKKEKDLFAVNKKINKTGLFKLNKVKLADAKAERSRIIGELVTDYQELDELKIKETISKHVTNDTNYYDILVFTSYNFLYFVRLLQSENEEMTLDNIEKKLKELKSFIYGSKPEILKSISIGEEKDVAKVISEMYKMNSIIVNEDKISSGQVDGLMESVDKMLIYFDIYTLMINLKDIKFLLNVPPELKK